MSEKTQENRKYRRFSRKIPLEFSLAELQEGLVPGVYKRKGVMVNVSQGGMCFECTNLRESTIKYLGQQNIMLSIHIHVPLIQVPIKVVGLVAWHKVSEENKAVHIVGIKFRSIKQDDLKLLFRQTSRFKFLVMFVIGLTLIFGLSLLFHFLINQS